MRIISIACFNLNSLRGKQPHRLDFEAAPLAGCGLFAISGPTGAGKTTLLDTITLALYGQTPRQSNGVVLSSHGASESWAEVVYEVEAGRFLAKWSLRWAFNRPGTTPKVTMQVTPWPRQEGDWQTQNQRESVAKNQELTGMRYEQFTRSVLLAQGGFADFLEAKDDERAMLLERMTGTGVYKTLSLNAHERLKVENATELRLLDQLGAVRLLAPGELTEKMVAADEKWQAVGAAKTAAEAWQAQLDWHQKIAGLRTKAALAAAEVEQADKTLAAHQQELARLTAHEPAEAFETTWRDCKRAAAEAAEAENRRQLLAVELARARTVEETAAAAVESARLAWVSATAQLELQRPALNAALAQLPNLKTLTKTAAEAQNTWLTNEAEHRAAELKHGIFSKQTAADQHELTALQTWLATHRADSELPSVLVQLGHLLDQRDRTTADYRERKQEANLLQSNLGQAAKEEADHRTNLTETEEALAELEATLLRQYAQHAGLVKAATERETTLTQALAAARHAEGDCYVLLLGKELFRDHAARLKTGCECPLCGALEHPVRSRHVDASDEALDALQTELVAHQEKVTLLDEQLKQNADLLARLNSPALRGAAAPDPAARALPLPLPEAMRSATLLLRDLANAPTQQARLEGQRKSFSEKADVAKVQQQTLQQQLDGLTTKLESILEQGEAASATIATLATARHTQFDRKQPLLLVSELHQRLENFTEKTRRHEELMPKLADATSHLKLLTSEVKRLADARPVLETASDKAAAEQQACAVGIAAAHPGYPTPQAALDFQEKAERQEQKKHDNLAEIGRQQTASVALLIEREQAQATLRDQHHVAVTALDQQLRHDLPAAGLPPDPAVLDSLLLPEPERSALRRLRATLDGTLATTRDYHTRCASELNSTIALALSPEPAEAVEQASDEARAQHLGLMKEHTLLEKELADEQAHQQQYADLGTKMAAQHRETLRWKTLHDLIGSSDGTRFSRFAQGLTLARLVGLANDHLRQFNDRYQLRRKDATSLALLVADAYDGCLRDASTLSGGETFLVSLALALGLSELASNAARIDSLFIDEGFGTLDAETLQVALAALGQLRDRGKTIGIITHIDPDKLEGHVDTRVVVERVGQGSSRLRVLPEMEPVVLA